MVSKAKDDLPEPERPVITVNLSRGISTSMLLRLCCRAPRTVMRSIAIRLEKRSTAAQIGISRDAERDILAEQFAAGQARKAVRLTFSFRRSYRSDAFS